jgi:hypothetical protein
MDSAMQALDSPLPSLRTSAAPRSAPEPARPVVPCAGPGASYDQHYGFEGALGPQDVARRLKLERQCDVDLSAPWPVFRAQLESLEQRFTSPAPAPASDLPLPQPAVSTRESFSAGWLDESEPLPDFWLGVP